MSSRWRPIVACAPVFGVVCLGWAALQGEPEILHEPAVYLALTVVSLVGWWVAWHTERVMRITPQVPIAQAQPGRVTFKGIAQSLPGRKPLISTTGRTCVWFHYREQDTLSSGGIQTSISQNSTNRKLHRRYESTHPFLIVDDSGKCLVIPRGADVSARNVDESIGHYETAILPGDEICISGQFSHFSPDAPPPQGNDDELPARVRSNASMTIRETTSIGIDSANTVREVVTTRSDGASQTTTTTRSAGTQPGMGGFGTLLGSALQGKAALKVLATEHEPNVDDAAAPNTQVSTPQLLSLPTVGMPDDRGIYIISSGTLDGDTGIYWLLKYINLLILLSVVAALVRTHLAAR